MDILFISLCVLFGAFIYFIPSLLKKNKEAQLRIFVLNLFLGWTLIGWVVALIWALGEEKPKQKPISANGNIADELAKLADLRDKGILTNEEFNHKKNQLLK